MCAGAQVLSTAPFVSNPTVTLMADPFTRNLCVSLPTCHD
jgi:hypothetical protein